TWSNDDLPELGGDTPLEVILSETRQAGYAGTEMGGKFPTDPKKLRPLLDKYGLALVSGWYNADQVSRSAEDAIAAVENHLNLLAAMGCKVMVFAEGYGTVQSQRDTPVSRRPRPDPDRWAEYGERLTRLAEHMLKRGVRMAFHYHMGTVVETAEEVDRLMENTGDAVGLLLDTGHITYAGGDPLALIRSHGSRICHVHCKDVRLERLEQAKARDSSFMNAVVDGVFTVPGDGDLDFNAILKALKETGYKGDWLVVEAEQDPAKAHPLTYATKGYQNLKQIVDRVGL
ncbi:MAG: myo-inosose-2 dehydratase, partial [Pseudomonadota bacterium]|nr:myo-inosose-2 dehydratase [Pseudomonadota bacterium]